MLQTKPAKLFKNGNSQAVRLPVDCRFNVNEVFIIKNEQTGDVLLSTKPSANVWADYFSFTKTLEDNHGFMENRELNQPPTATGIFDDMEA
jgi:antitoxin VapB